MSEEQLNMDKKISVIVPIYKVEKYLDRCINSIINQTYSDLEIILIDDGSPDNCPAMCDEWAKKDDRIKVIHKQNGGLMAAWIDGVKNATSDYISFVDSDDWCELDMIEELYKPFKEFDVDLTICDYYRAKDTSKTIEPGIKIKTENLLQGEEFEKIKNNQLREITSYRWNKLYKKEFIVNNLQYCDTRVTLCEDVGISVASTLDSKKIYYVNKPLYNYYDRGDSMVNTFKSNMLTNFEYFYPPFLSILKDKGYASDINLGMQLITIFHIVVKNIMLSKAKHKRKLFKATYNSFLYKEFLTVNLKQIKNRAHKIFARTYKTKSYFLVRSMLFAQQTVSKIRTLFKKKR